MTAKSAALILGITEYSVYRLIKNGTIAAKKFGPVWMVDSESVEDYKSLVAGKAKHDPTRGKQED